MVKVKPPFFDRSDDVDDPMCFVEMLLLAITHDRETFVTVLFWLASMADDPDEPDNLKRTYEAVQEAYDDFLELNHEAEIREGSEAS